MSLIYLQSMKLIASENLLDKAFITKDFDYFTLEWGVRQEDPCSPYLLLLVAETLAVSIRENPEIVGIKIGKNEIKVLQ